MFASFFIFFFYFCLLSLSHFFSLCTYLLLVSIYLFQKSRKKKNIYIYKEICKSLICCSIFVNKRNAIQKKKTTSNRYKNCRIKSSQFKVHRKLIQDISKVKKIQYNGFFSVDCSIKIRQIPCQLFPANIRYTRKTTSKLLLLIIIRLVCIKFRRSYA